MVFMFKNKHFLIFLFAIAFVMKLMFFMLFLRHNSCMLEFDSAQYHKVALNISSGMGISNDCGTPHFYRVPGYPLFLAASYSCFGQDPVWALITQMFFGAFIAWLIFFLTLVLFPRQKKVAMVASIISCFDLGYLIFPGLVYTETLFTLFFTIFLILFFKNLNLVFCKVGSNASLIGLFAAGFFLGSACLIRQVAPAMLCTSVFLLLFTQKKFRSIISLLCGFLFATGWWLVRNYLLTGYIFFGTLSGPHFLNHASVRLEMMQNNASHDQAKQVVYKRFDDLCRQKELQQNRPLHEIERCLIAENMTVQYCLQKPFLTVRFGLANILKSAFGLYSSELLCIDSDGSLPPYDNKRGLFAIFKRFLLPDVSNKLIIPVIYFEMLFFLFLLIGLLMFCASVFFSFNNFCVALKLFPFIGSTLFITLACGYARLRLPIEGFLIILASKAWIDLLRGSDER